jgi:hypothetical protein
MPTFDLLVVIGFHSIDMIHTSEPVMGKIGSYCEFGQDIPSVKQHPKKMVDLVTGPILGQSSARCFGLSFPAWCH